MHTTTVLLVLDGWGCGVPEPHNAIHMANTPCWDRLLSTAPNTQLHCSGETVGLPPGQMGNSEVGHMTMGAGRVIRQDLTRIDHAIEHGEFASSEGLSRLFHDAAGSYLHVLGLVSPGGVHSHENHLFETLKLAAAHDVRVVVHAFLDGRDTPPKSARTSIEACEALCKSQPNIELGSVCGRYYAMDRDERWERTALAYDLLIGKNAVESESGLAALDAAYVRGETDEFVKPTRIKDSRSIQDGDSVLFMNFRADRARQLTRVLLNSAEVEKPIPNPVRLRRFAVLTPYGDDIDNSVDPPVDVVFARQRVPHTFSDCLAEAELRQLRLAETEKAPHVTYFFSCGTESVAAQENHVIIPSPKVASYDLKPEMSAFEVTTQLVSAIDSSSYDCIVCNLANADMVGHTGDFHAAVKAVEAIDRCLTKLTDSIDKNSVNCLITADHGNAEKLVDTSAEQPHTAHTHNDVPCIYLGNQCLALRDQGTLADIAPTLLHLLGLDIPAEMTGTSLIR